MRRRDANNSMRARGCGGAQRMHLRTRIRRGFTLIEAISTIVILSAISTLASHILLTASDGYLDASIRAQLHNEASVALDRIAREVRRIPFDEDADEDVIAADIDAVTTSSISWNDDGVITLSGTNIMLTEPGGAAAVLAADVSAFAIRCYNESNGALAVSLSGDACDAIRRVQITLTLTRDGVSETLRTRVFVRSTLVGSGAPS